jgi:Skp family chaperone for outer membrane proteins
MICCVRSEKNVSGLLGASAAMPDAQMRTPTSPHGKAGSADAEALFQARDKQM